MTRTTPRPRIPGLLPCSLRLPLLVLLVWAGTACSGEEVFTPLTTTALGDCRIEASRTSGVAPLLVHFQAGDLLDPEDSEPFLNNHYRWDFGDPAGGNWGTDGKSRNTASGGITAHVYDTPGTYTVSLMVRTLDGREGGDSTTITVIDPETVYAGSNTVCISDNGDFTGAPAGARLLTETNMTVIASHAKAGIRILFRRGGHWTAGDIGTTAWHGNTGPVTLGAFGPGSGADALGIHDNAPRISLRGGTGTFFSVNSKQDWRIMDLHFDDPEKGAHTSGIEGGYEFRDILVYRMRITGFYDGVCWSHWNRDPVITIERNSVVSCDVYGLGNYGLYVGSERLVVLGNKVRDIQGEHVLRVWQAWHSLIAHNQLSGASLNGILGDHALKLHGPGIGPDNCLGEPLPNTPNLARRTDYVVVSDNVFGTSGPWPVMIAPTNPLQNEELSHIVFERNLLSAGFGTHVTTINFSLQIAAHHVTVRNNVIDATGASSDWTGVVIRRYGVEPPPDVIRVCNNTIYRSDNGTPGQRIGIRVDSSVRGIRLANNLLVLPAPSTPPVLIQNGTGHALQQSNLLITTAGLVDPDNADPLARDFAPLGGSPALGGGVPVPVFDFFDGTARPAGVWDSGACAGP